MNWRSIFSFWGLVKVSLASIGIPEHSWKPLRLRPALPSIAELSKMSMDVFSRMVERSNGRPDTLAVRVIRYILLNRRRLVALVVRDDSPAARELARYAPLVEIGS